MKPRNTAVWFILAGLLVCAVLLVTLCLDSDSLPVSASNQAASFVAAPAAPDSASPQAQLTVTDTAALLAAQISLFPDVFLADLPVVMK